MDLADVNVFLSLVKRGSVLAAAKELGVSRATIRRRLEVLEQEIGRPLFERHKDDVVLTRVGRLLEREGPALLGSARRLEGALKQVGREAVSGTLTVAMPSGLPGALFTAFARELAERWPELELVGFFAPDPLAELEREADVAIASGERPGEPWVARLLGDFEERALAARSYVERAGVPRSLAELDDHRLLSWSTPDRDPTRWPLRRGGAHVVRPALSTNDLRSLQECVDAGLGIGLLPIWPDLSGRHVVLPNILGRRRRFWLASAAASRWSPSVQAFGQALASFLAEELTRPQGPEANRDPRWFSEER
ncbi:Transcriptional regulator, LysR family protein [Minicystis rosea]|nr:Transcriptional regulator, LysR family protein [Minicystis rosea]